MAAPERRVRRRELHVRDPGLEELGAERQDVLRAIEVVARDLVAPECEPPGRAQRFVLERLNREMATAAERVEPRARQRRERAGRHAAKPCDAVRTTRTRFV